MEGKAGKGLRLVGFDGGGIRSLSQLNIMESLIQRLEYEENPDDSDKEILPCDCVEMMGGSDTGGLIALMFGKLRMSVNDTIKEFHKICCEVYISDLSPSMRTQKLKDCIEDLLRRKGLPVDLKLGNDDRVAEQGCPCFVIATPKANMTSKVKLRTYRSRTERPLDVTLVEAILATCATQPTFLPISIGLDIRRQELVGGAMGTANPCRELILEAQDKFKRTTQVSTIISLGSGHLGTLSGATEDKDWMEVLRNMVESCERTAQEIETQIGHFDVYSRFSVEQGLQRLYGAKADNLQWLNTQTAAYVQDVEVSRRLDECVERIVSRQQVITLEQLGLSRVPRADLQSIQSVTQGLLLSAQDEELLKELRPKDFMDAPPVEACLDGTREDILQKVVNWKDDFDAPNILWLKAFPGAGKTAIALTLVKRLRQLNRLGSSFFFQRANAAKLTSHALWRKTAFDLACKVPTIRATLVKKIKSDRDAVNTSDIDDLFQQIIEEPFLAAEGTSTNKPLVVVVDGLDECGGLDGPYSKDRKALLRTLQKWSSLPCRSKLIVTSRHEDDIERVLQSISHVVEISTGSSTRDKSWYDIKQFLTLRFEEIARPYTELGPQWPGSQVIERLADRAGGLFIWARTVIEFIGRGAVEQQLSRILKQTSGMGNIAALYSEILSISFPEETDDIVEAFCSTLGAVIFAKTPLSLVSLSRLLLIDRSRVEHICTKLKSVLHVGDTIQATHQSFVDFLLDPRACPLAFYIRSEDEEHRLAVACLQAMRQNLRFNICDLEDSCLLNSEIDDMESRIIQNIPDHVLYSCRYGVEHITSSKYDAKLLHQIRDFVENQFLFWLEVLSVTNQISITLNMLSLLMGWMKKHNQDESMVAEMKKFATTFASVIAQSAPHIYMSALPFIPRHSAVSKHYADRYPGSLRVKSGGLEEWPGFECVMYGHMGVVSSVAFSQDGTRIVSGSSDTTVRLWNAATGQPLGSPFVGHTTQVRSVAFSPDETRIISVSEDDIVRMLDAATAQPLEAPFKAHIGGISSLESSLGVTHVVLDPNDGKSRLRNTVTAQRRVSFEDNIDYVTPTAFSPDQTRIVLGFADKTMRVWDAATGRPLGAPFKGHTGHVRSVAFSPEGTHIVSGSDDKTVRVWDAVTGRPLGAPFKGHNGCVTSVAFSPEGTRIVSGSNDMTVRVWDVAAVQPLGAPFDSHTQLVTSVAFSPDGTRIVSGSNDKTVRVWDAVTGRPLGAPFKGHNGCVTSVAFSPEGTRVVSGSDDTTVRMWDATTGQPLGVPLEGHTSYVASAAFSPDGTHLVSISSDDTTLMWDAATSQALGASFKCHRRWIRSSAFLPDRTRIVLGLELKKIQLRGAATSQRSGEPFKDHTEYVTMAAFSPDGTRIVSGSKHKTVQLWDAATSQPLGAPFKGHTGHVRSVAFSPDGTRVVSGSDDKTVRMWDTVIYDAKKSLSFRRGFEIVEDWVLNSNSERLFWVLPSLQAGLWLPGSSAILGNVITKVNMERFQYGKSWATCQGKALER